ncbi:hypothetical protein Z968_00715 [Clostridium novyi A str. 4552]|uniref:Uncharacterized protein n=1 Tax=Clostridium novyi A str. 4552 TaxID=1444289 RepID=A0A0A0IA19_CLONO|nr:hypothetical protein [Clostridium novyi]KGM98289.1 hypothetical protein Z968_00715 [Clostridium novyi A str. 4552]
MVLSLKEKNEYRRYIVNSLVQKFRCCEEDAKAMVENSCILDEIANDFDKVICFNSDEIAELLISKNKQN